MVLDKHLDSKGFSFFRSFIYSKDAEFFCCPLRPLRLCSLRLSAVRLNPSVRPKVISSRTILFHEMNIHLREWNDYVLFFEAGVDFFEQFMGDQPFQTWFGNPAKEFKIN